MSRDRCEVAIVGAGLAGNLLAIMLARRGLEPLVYERGPAPEAAGAPRGRTINLALAARGMAALEAAGTLADVEPLLLPMAGRIVHDATGQSRFLAYGQRADERIYSVSRAGLNECLYRIARDRHGVRYRFEHAAVGIDTDTGIVRTEGADGRADIDAPIVIAADGAGSVLRRELAAAGRIAATESLLDHGYKELSLPPTAAGGFALEANGLHIWPRGGYMLIALPNIDCSFTATLFLPQTGSVSFAALGAGSIGALFEREFADVAKLLPRLADEFAERPTGELGTVSCRPWSFRPPGAARRLLLLGDAAHAIVPFHGQGMNAAFEDCRELDALVAHHRTDWDRILTDFEAGRRANTEAIAEMALENYVEMRDGVRDPGFEQKQAAAFELERRYPGRFVPRYSMVMFHPEIDYAEARRRGRIQADIIEQATSRAGTEVRVDLERASRLVEERL